MKHIYPAVLTMMLATPVLAQTDWVAGVSRGLETYALEQSGGTVTLICDPDRLFGNDASNASLRVTFLNGGAPSRLVLLAASGEQATLDIVQGGANEATLDPIEWSKMVTILSAGGDFAFVTSADALQFEDVTPLPDLMC